MPVAEIGQSRVRSLADGLMSSLHDDAVALVEDPLALENEEKVDDVTVEAIKGVIAVLQTFANEPRAYEVPKPKRVYRVEAKYEVEAVFEVIAFDEDEAKELVAGRPSATIAKSIGYGLDRAAFDVDFDSIQVEDIGESTPADDAQTDQVEAIRP